MLGVWECSPFLVSRAWLFFSSPLDLWDTLPADRDTRYSRASLRFVCTAKHNSFSHPTTLCNGYHRKNELFAQGDTYTSPNDNSDCSILGSSFTLNEEVGEEDEEGSVACDDNPAAGGFSDNTSCYECENATLVVLDNQLLP